MAGDTRTLRERATGTTVPNVNVGVLGHVDSGKTALVACLSTYLSTAALDKHPQSQQRGITLDLGFSSLVIEECRDGGDGDGDGDEGGEGGEGRAEATPLQITLVDCPGHASLVRTVVGGSHIIDMMMLVVDITKGIQPQTAECLVIGELTTEHLLVVLNKVDLIPVDKRASYVKKASKMIGKTLDGTRFAGASVVPASAKGGDVTALVAALGEMAGRVARGIAGKRARDDAAPFLMHIDHCFAIKGQGTVVTGTISAGTVSVGQTISLPELGLERKVKSIQAFKKVVPLARSGDRVGVCLANVNATSIERGLACAPGSMVRFSKAVASVHKVRFYPDRLLSKRKIHILIGHASVMGTVEFFGTPRVSYAAVRGGGGADDDSGVEDRMFSFERDYLSQTELYGHEGRPEVGDDGEECPTPFHVRVDDRRRSAVTLTTTTSLHVVTPTRPRCLLRYRSHAPVLTTTRDSQGPQWALITFDEQIISRPGELLLGAKLDAQLDSCGCRIAMKGVLDFVKVEEKETIEGGRSGGVRLFKVKTKRGTVDSVEAATSSADGEVTATVCGGMFGPNSVMTKFLGMHCVCVCVRVRAGKGGEIRTTVPGRLESRFGGEGQCRVVFAKPVRVGDVVLLNYKKMLGTGDIKQ